MKKKRILFYIAIIILGGLCAFLIIKNNHLQKQLSTAHEELSIVKSYLEMDHLATADSLLITGSYEDAKKAYHSMDSLSIIEDDYAITSRLKIAENMLRMHEEIKTVKTSSTSPNADSAAASNINSSVTLEKFDSLNFAFEKKQLQLSRLKEQMNKKAFGEYLTFKSKKGNRLFYVGQVKNHKANGFGIAILDTGSRYEGEWENNMRHGNGSFYWIDGERYEGEYRKDMRTGQGTYYWPNGEKYVGEWKDDVREGTGTFYNSDGEVFAKGIWKGDKLIKKEK
ncbi:hypothetical protein HX109_00890 [Galbibacter sp. BG1]|uniref:MORN repeat-containing protein n=1 Tax=Galbibacter sp. BG1 TaxID=1170699 RepID=UPI0015BA837B|nr:hypothetical protein [Galbibacter sp. BG1]QLE00185.1 hypothetical protein HX109_00890 [Galbibacter sp. BG1]